MNKLYIIISYLLVTLTGCSETENKDDSLFEPKSSIVSLWIGETHKVISGISSGSNNYTLVSDNPQIASALLIDNNETVIVSSFNSGNTVIRLVDDNTKKVLHDIYVSVVYFSSEKIEEVYFPPNKSGVFVECQDVEVQKTIEKELWDELKQRELSVYTFCEETKKFTMDIVELGIYKEGIYEWTINSLTLKYDNITENYGFKIANSRNGYIIEEDKTIKYQILYPNAGITKVTMTRVWRDCYILTDVGGLTP